MSCTTRKKLLLLVDCCLETQMSSLAFQASVTESIAQSKKIRDEIKMHIIMSGLKLIEGSAELSDTLIAETSEQFEEIFKEIEIDGDEWEKESIKDIKRNIEAIKNAKNKTVVAIKDISDAFEEKLEKKFDTFYDMFRK